MSQKKSRQTDEYKADAVELAIQSGNVAQTARNLGINISTLNSWIKKAEDESSAGALKNDEREELIRLRKEAETLLLERDVLKKVAQHFVKDSERSK